MCVIFEQQVQENMVLAMLEGHPLYKQETLNDITDQCSSVTKK